MVSIGNKSKDKNLKWKWISYYGRANILTYGEFYSMIASNISIKEAIDFYLSGQMLFVLSGFTKKD